VPLNHLASFQEIPVSNTLDIEFYSDSVVQLHFPNNKIFVKALCDTGAAISACSESIIAKLVPQYKRSLVSSSRTFNVANNKRVKPIGSTALGFKIQNKWFSTQVFVFKELSHQFILGRPFLVDNEAILDFGKQRMSLKPSKLHAIANHTIKPKSFCIIPTRITNKHAHVHFSTGQVGKVSQLQETTEIVDAVVSMSDNMAPVIVKNNSNKYINIFGGQNIYNAVSL